jgi:hypothetical protein
VDEEKATHPKLAEVAEDMLRSGFLDGLTRLLESRFPGVRLTEPLGVPGGRSGAAFA